MSDNQRYYETLGLTPDASLEEIRQTYKDLIQVWHPDRFSYNPRLREKAEEKLKEINLAYEYVIAELNNPSEKQEYAKQSEKSYKKKKTKTAASHPKSYRFNRRYLQYITIGIVCAIVISAITIFIQKKIMSSEIPAEKNVPTSIEEFERELRAELKKTDKKMEKIHREDGEYLVLKKEKQEHLEIVGKKKKSSDTATIPKHSYRQEINQAQIEKLKEILNSYDRYLDNKDGTITDKISGLTWNLANSYLELGKYMNYAEAKNYVRSLRTGGYSDWRLPTTSELAGIYAKKPFFPNIGATWYWSSDTYNSGWDVVVAIIKPENKEVFIRKYTKQTDEGAVHAVRP